MHINRHSFNGVDYVLESDCNAEIKRLEKEIEQLKERLSNIYKAGYSDISISHARIDEAVEEEQKRWCEELDFLHTEYGADCSGCDSGDPLDCVEVEIRQALENVRVTTATEIITLIMEWEGTWSVLDFKDAIKEKFGLEI